MLGWVFYDGNFDKYLHTSLYVCICIYVFVIVIIISAQRGNMPSRLQIPVAKKIHLLMTYNVKYTCTFCFIQT